MEQFISRYKERPVGYQPLTVASTFVQPARGRQVCGVPMQDIVSICLCLGEWEAPSGQARGLD